MSTLEYAQNAKAIINKAKINSIQQRLELKELREQHAKLTELYALAPTRAQAALWGISKILDHHENPNSGSIAILLISIFPRPYSDQTRGGARFYFIPCA